jgi:hypothetical protein
MYNRGYILREEIDEMATEAQKKATAKYNRIIELFPDTDVANRAKTLMAPAEATGSEGTTGE